ncbi:MAG: hypothetical protein KC519_15735, partial [Anaerolineae bacterium]|nr:hypothetical protein [Anaerolineae bacterium]
MVLLLVIFAVLPFLTTTTQSANIIQVYLITEGIPGQSVTTRGEVFFSYDFSVSYAGGNMTLSANSDGTGNTLVDDAIEIVVTRPDGSVVRFVHSYQSGCAVLNPLTPRDVSALFQHGVNQVSVHLFDICGVNSFSNPLYLVSNDDNVGQLSTGYISPTSFTDDDGTWNNEPGAYFDDGAFAESSFRNNRAGRWHSYPVTVPANAIINGIDVRVDASGFVGVGWLEIQVSNGAQFSTARVVPGQSLTLPTAKTSYIVGGTTDLWGLTWSPTQINQIQVRVRVVNFREAHRLWWIPIKVHYTLPTPPFVCDTSPYTRLNTCLLEPGDILLETSLGSQTVIGGAVGTYWFHTAMYYGDGKIVDAAGRSTSADRTQEVAIRPIRDTEFYGYYDEGDHSLHYARDWVVLRLKQDTIDRETIIDLA